jgi:hypothetical protein
LHGQLHRLAGSVTIMRILKKEVLTVLQADDFLRRVRDLCALPARQVVNPLFSFFLHTDERTRWRAITAMGAVVAGLADKDMESARVVMRRLMWSLNDESGGIGWGAPEAIGEILAVHEGLAKEYGTVLISFIWKDGNFLEHEILQRGALWGVGRAAHARPEIMKGALPHLVAFLDASDAAARGFAAWAIGALDPKPARSKLEALLNDDTQISIYADGEIRSRRVSDLARSALISMEDNQRRGTP